MVLILAAPVVINIEYGRAVRLRVRYVFITLYRFPPKPKRSARSKKRKQTSAEASEENAAVQEASAAQAAPPSDDSVKTEKKPKQKKQKNPKVPTLSELFELIRVLVDSLGKPLKKLLKRIEIRDFDIRVLCGGEDAAKAALKFGAVNLAVGNALGFLSSFFTLKQPHVDINVDFQSEKTEAELSCTVKMCMMIFLMFLFTFLGRLIVRVLHSEKTKGWLSRFTAKGGDKSAGNKV